MLKSDRADSRKKVFSDIKRYNPFRMDLIQKKTNGGKVMNKKANILLAVGVLALIIGVLLEYYQRPTCVGYRYCNLVIYDTTFQIRSFKSLSKR